MRSIGVRAVGVVLLLVVVGCGRESSSNASSPPKGTIVFSSDMEGSFDIYTIKTDGTDLERITDDPGRERDPSWSPDGRSLVYSSTPENGSDSELHIMDANGDNDRAITDDDVDERFPDWSPNGRDIVFSYGAVGDEWLIMGETNGTRSKVLLKNDVYGNQSPDWSPTGREILFNSSNGRLYMLPQAGSNPRRVDNLIGFHPVWDPNGRRFAFEAQDESGDGRLAVWVADISGKNPEALVGDTSGGPSWSPDGEWIAFVSSPLDNPVSVLRAIPVTGGTPVEIFDSGATIGEIDWNPVDTS